MMNRLSIGAFLVLTSIWVMLFGYSGFAYAGASSKTSQVNPSSYGTSNNWAPNGRPGNGDWIVLGGTQNISANLAVTPASLDVNNHSGQTLSVAIDGSGMGSIADSSGNNGVMKLTFTVASNFTLTGTAGGTVSANTYTGLGEIDFSGCASTLVIAATNAGLTVIPNVIGDSHQTATAGQSNNPSSNANPNAHKTQSGGVVDSGHANTIISTSTQTRFDGLIGTGLSTASTYPVHGVDVSGDTTFTAATINADTAVGSDFAGGFWIANDKTLTFNGNASGSHGANAITVTGLINAYNSGQGTLQTSGAQNVTFVNTIGTDANGLPLSAISIGSTATTAFQSSISATTTSINSTGTASFGDTVTSGVTFTAAGTASFASGKNMTGNVTATASDGTITTAGDTTITGLINATSHVMHLRPASAHTLAITGTTTATTASIDNRYGVFWRHSDCGSYFYSSRNSKFRIW